MESDNNTIIITGTNGTMDTITMASGYSYTLSSDTIDLGNYCTTSPSNYYSIFNESFEITQQVFEDCMPDVNRIKDMCKHYPALAKAFENFKTIYTMVDQDYKGNYQDD